MSDRRRKTDNPNPTNPKRGRLPAKDAANPRANEPGEAAEVPQAAPIVAADHPAQPQPTNQAVVPLAAEGAAGVIHAPRAVVPSKDQLIFFLAQLGLPPILPIEADVKPLLADFLAMPPAAPAHPVQVQPAVVLPGANPAQHQLNDRPRAPVKIENASDFAALFQQVPAIDIKTEEQVIILRLTECAEKQRKDLEQYQAAWNTWEDRYSRLAYYENFLNNYEKRARNIADLQNHQKAATMKLKALEKKEGDLYAGIQKMIDQDKRLRRVLECSGEYHRYRLSPAVEQERARMHMPNQDELNSVLNALPCLNEMLVTTGISFRMEAPALCNNDLDEIPWASLDKSYEKYKMFEYTGFGMGGECVRLAHERNNWENKIHNVLPSYNYLQSRKELVKQFPENAIIREQVNDQRAKVKDEYVALVALIKKIHMRKASIETFKKEELRLSAVQSSRNDHLKEIRKEVNEELFKCGICLQIMTIGDSSVRCPKIFSKCGHTVCAQCVPNFKDPSSAPRWLCPECRTPSEPLLTNWFLMRMIDPDWDKSHNSTSME